MVRNNGRVCFSLSWSAPRDRVNHKLTPKYNDIVYSVSVALIVVRTYVIMYCTVDKSHPNEAPATQAKNAKDGKSLFVTFLICFNYISETLFALFLVMLEVFRKCSLNES